jgi:prolyl 4-hydroxylase
MCDALKLPKEFGENIQGQFYEPGQYFKQHTDYFDPGSASYEHHTKGVGNRTWTFMVYLNNTVSGGHTFFPKLNIDFKPQQGCAVIWNNQMNGKLNHATLHEGTPIESGFKAILTKWFREKTPNARTIAGLPKFTKTGFKVANLPHTLYSEIFTFYQKNMHRFVHETHGVKGFVNSDVREWGSELLDLSSELKRKLHDQALVMHEEWCGTKLKQTYVYGIRKYLRGSMLKAHVDRIETHIISCIINVDQHCDTPWALEILDHDDNEHSVTLKPGQIVFYESARLMHGRKYPLNGDYYANIFVHYMPVNW